MDLRRHINQQNDLLINKIIIKLSVTAEFCLRAKGSGTVCPCKILVKNYTVEINFIIITFIFSLQLLAHLKHLFFTKIDN